MSSGVASASLMPVVTADASTAGGVGGVGVPTAAGPAVGAGGDVVLALAPPGPDGEGASPPTGGAPPTDVFASVLSDQVARTALAEGQSKQTSTKGGPRNTDANGDASATDTVPADATSAPGTDPTSLLEAVMGAGMPTAQPLPSATAPAGAPVAQAPDTPALPGVGAAPATAATSTSGNVRAALTQYAAGQAPTAPPATDTVPGTGTGTAPAASASPTAPPLAPAPAATVLTPTAPTTPPGSPSTALPAAAVTATPPTTSAPTAPATTPAPDATAPATAAVTAVATQPASAAPATSTAQPAPDNGVAAVSAHTSTAGTGGHGSAADGDRAGQNPSSGGAGGGVVPAPAAAAPATAPVAPTAPVPSAAPTASSSATVPTAYGVRLAEAAEKVSNTIAMGARDGVSVARIELAPESLGAIQIHLQHTSDGLVARVITEHPEAAQTLAQSSGDLKRQLQQNGTALLRLDIESSGQQRSGDQQAGSTPGSGSGARSGGDAAADDGAAIEAAAAETPLQTLSGSALVNVLA
jgi:flagellar hook-length control protein FliK